jgi:hypothetical protein
MLDLRRGRAELEAVYGPSEQFIFSLGLKTW